MKTFAAAALATSAFAGNALTDHVHNRVFDYFGLTKEMPQEQKEMHELVKSVKDKPDVQMYGTNWVEVIDDDGHIMLGYELNADVGYQTHYPMYAENDNVIARQRISAVAGGRQEFYVQFYLYRINLYFDTFLAKLTLDNYLSYDAVNREEFCYAGNWFLDIARMSLLLQVDVKSCKHGVLGFISDEISGCGWDTYYIMKPLWDKLLNDTERGELYGTCEGDIKPYGY